MCPNVLNGQCKVPKRTAKHLPDTLQLDYTIDVLTYLAHELKCNLLS